jgi:hypothetical protein
MPKIDAQSIFQLPGVLFLAKGQHGVGIDESKGSTQELLFQECCGVPAMSFLYRKMSN